MYRDIPSDLLVGISVPLMGNWLWGLTNAIIILTGHKGTGHSIAYKGAGHSQWTYGMGQWTLSLGKRVLDTPTLNTWIKGNDKVTTPPTWSLGNWSPPNAAKHGLMLPQAMAIKNRPTRGPILMIEKEDQSNGIHDQSCSKWNRTRDQINFFTRYVLSLSKMT